MARDYVLDTRISLVYKLTCGYGTPNDESIQIGIIIILI
jgi:hypothetical protein